MRPIKKIYLTTPRCSEEESLKELVKQLVESGYQESDVISVEVFSPTPMWAGPMTMGGPGKPGLMQIDTGLVPPVYENLYGFKYDATAYVWDTETKQELVD